jgi:hypothetical protein
LEERHNNYLEQLLMAIFDAEEREDEQPEEELGRDKTDYGYLIVLLLMLPLIIFPFLTGRTELMIGVSLSAVMNCLSVAKCWDLRKHGWFWIVVALLQTIHISLAYFAHWPRVTMTRLTLLPIGAMYYFLTVGVARAIAKITSSESQGIDPTEKSNGPA